MKGTYRLSNHIKRYLLDKFGNKCCICGWGKRNPYTGKIPLEADHIDGNYKNNRPDNLRLVCPNCHSLTSSYKGANMAKGREERLKHYYNKPF